MTTRPRLLATLVACGLAVSACAGPSVETSVGMRETAVDVLYGDGSPPPPPPAPPAADPSPSFPGFIQPAPPRPAPPATAPTAPTTTTTTTTPPNPCPTADPFAVPAEQATTGVAGPPAPGTYTFRQEGTAVIGDDEPVTLPPLGDRTVEAVEEIVPGVIRFDVRIVQFDATTITTYQVDQRGVDDGVFIAQVRSDDELGTQVFSPSAPVKILALPAAIGNTWSSTGTDPLHGTSITINGEVTERRRIDACGTVVDSWQVEVGPDPVTGQPSRVTNRASTFELTATFGIATQLGGLIVFDEEHLVGVDTLQPATIDSTATANQIVPEPPA